MQNRNNAGVDPPDKAQAAVAQARFLRGANPRATHPNDQAAALPPLDALPRAWGTPQAGAVDHGDCSATPIAAMEARALEPYIAPGRVSPHPSWQASLAQQPAPPPADAHPKGPRADTRPTEMGGAVSRVRPWTVEPVRGSIKDLLGLRPGSLRGLWAAAGAWCLGWRAFNWKRLQTWTIGSGR
jgi:hypothetical protein